MPQAKTDREDAGMVLEDAQVLKAVESSTAYQALSVRRLCSDRDYLRAGGSLWSISNLGSYRPLSETGRQAGR